MLSRVILFLLLMASDCLVAAVTPRYSEQADDANMGPFVLFDARPRPRGPAVTVEWLTSRNVNRDCQKVMGRDTPYEVEACAVYFPNKARCVIITAPKTTLWAIGHEFRHCVQGSWHGEPLQGSYVPNTR